MSKSIAIPDEVVMNKIYLIREQKVMLDRDLAELYGVKAIRLREQVKRNQERFPENFMFQLNEKEVENYGIAKCDTFKAALRWFTTLCLHGAWRIDVS